MKQLQDIVKTLETPHVEGNTAVEVLDITADSRAVKAGSLFIALDGATVDGHNYVNKAVEAGAVAAGNVGHVVSTHVIPRPHNDIESLLAK